MHVEWKRSVFWAALALGGWIALCAGSAGAGEISEPEDINQLITRAPAGSTPFLDAVNGNGWNMFDQFTYHGDRETAIGSIDIILLDPEDLIDPETQQSLFSNVEPTDDLQAVIDAAVDLYGDDGFLNWGIRGWKNADPSHREWVDAAFPNLPGVPSIPLATPILLVPGESDMFLLNTVAYNEILSALSPMSEATGELIVGWRFNEIPEPNSLVLLGAGVLALALRARSRAR